MTTESSTRSARRGPGRPFRKGQSGNPHGRPRGSLNKATADIRALAQGLTLGDPEFVARLREQLRAGTYPPALVQTLLAYGYGRPRDLLEVTGEVRREPAVVFYLPDNGRSPAPPPTGHVAAALLSADGSGANAKAHGPR